MTGGAVISGSNPTLIDGVDTSIPLDSMATAVAFLEAGGRLATGPDVGRNSEEDEVVDAGMGKSGGEEKVHSIRTPRGELITTYDSTKCAA